MENIDASEPSVDVRQIMAGIKAEIAEKHLTDNLPKFEEPEMSSEVVEPFNLMEYNEAVSVMNSSWDMNPWFELTGNGLKKFFKRVIRKLNKFLLENLCTRQTQFNSFSVRAQNQIQGFINEQQDDKILIERQAAEIETLRDQVQSLSARIESLEKKVSS